MKTKVNPPVSDYSPITATALVIFDWAKWLSPMKWIAFLSPYFRSRSELTQEEVSSKEFVKKRAKLIEMYMVIWWAIEVLIVALICNFHWSVLLGVGVSVVVLTRVIEIIQVTVNATLFDALSGRADELIASSRLLKNAFSRLSICIVIGRFGQSHFLYSSQDL